MLVKTTSSSPTSKMKGVNFRSDVSKRRRDSWWRKRQQRNRAMRAIVWQKINAVLVKSARPLSVGYSRIGLDSTYQSGDGGNGGSDYLLPEDMATSLETALSNPFVHLAYDGKKVIPQYDEPSCVRVHPDSIEYVTSQVYFSFLQSPNPKEWLEGWKMMLEDPNIEIRRQGDIAHIRAYDVTPQSLSEKQLCGLINSSGSYGDNLWEQNVFGSAPDRSLKERPERILARF